MQKRGSKIIYKNFVHKMNQFITFETNDELSILTLEKYFFYINC